MEVGTMDEINRRAGDENMNRAKVIYIADDEANIRVAIKAFLENAGYAVTDFENGDLLLTAFKEHEADLVILDVMMPGSNGFVICKELRKISHVPIFMLTARDSDLDYATGLDLGSDDYLTKPFSPMALVMRVKAIFRRMEYDKHIYTERDQMTGMFNKNSGINLIENELMISDENSLHAFFVIDIDNFKSVNDNLGHAFGDKVIIEAAGSISNIFRKSDIVCRFGGDEFIAFAKNIVEVDYASQKAEEICKVLRKSYGKGGNINISASVGIACYPIHGLSYDELFNHADKAMYEVKEKGRGGYLMYLQTKSEKHDEN